MKNIADKKKTNKKAIELISTLKELPYESRLCQNGSGLYYCGTCDQPWDDCSCPARNTGYRRAIMDVIQLLSNPSLDREQKTK